MVVTYIVPSYLFVVLDKMLNGLVVKILNERKTNGMVTAIVCGKFGIGKTMYCIKTAYQLFRELGYDKNDAYMKSLGSIVFEPKEFGKKLKATDDPLDILIMDDASVHIGNDLYKTNPKRYSAFRQVLTTIRTKTNCLLYNCANSEEIAKFIRESDAYQIYIRKRHGYDRIATAWAWKRIATKVGMRRIQHRVWIDEFSCYIPNKYFDIYKKKRKKYIDNPIENLIDGGEDGKEKRSVGR